MVFIRAQQLTRFKVPQLTERSPESETIRFLYIDTALTAVQCPLDTNWGTKSGREYVLIVRSCVGEVAYQHTESPRSVFNPTFRTSHHPLTSNLTQRKAVGGAGKSGM